MIIKILRKLKLLIFPNPKTVTTISAKDLLLSQHAKIDTSSIIKDMNLDLRNPLNEKLYVTIGKDCMIHANIIFESEQGEVVIGDRVFLGSSTIISRTKVEFGNDIFVAWGAYFYDHDSHSLDYRERRKDILRQLDDCYTKKPNFIYSKDWKVVNTKPIKICNDAWIGMHAIILKGVTIGEGAIVGAGSVVTKDVAPWTVVAGNPAKVVKEIPLELRNNSI
jgi:galactoside O-acetyltransferase